MNRHNKNAYPSKEDSMASVAVSCSDCSVQFFPSLRNKVIHMTAIPIIGRNQDGSPILLDEHKADEPHVDYICDGCKAIQMDKWLKKK